VQQWGVLPGDAICPCHTVSALKRERMAVIAWLVPITGITAPRQLRVHIFVCRNQGFAAL
jgi:hypothetical protein